MELHDPLYAAAALAATILMLSWLALRRRARGSARAPRRPEALDTVAGWPPEAARVLTVDERQAYELLKRSLPGFMVLAQVPLSRFIRVPSRHSYTDWMQRVGQLSADLLVCDSGSRVLAVVDIRSTAETERSKRRHERLTRVLRAANIRVHTWYEGSLPGVSEVRTLFTATLMENGQTPTASRPMPLIPVPEIEEILADGDAMDHSMEPVPSGFYDDLEPAPAGR